MKKESPILFDDIKGVIEKSIQKINETTYNNYFLHEFQSDTLLNPKTTRKHIPKIYKIDSKKYL